MGSSFIRAPFCVLPRVSTIAVHQLPVSSLPPEVHVEPHKKQLHVTLAYHFQASHLPTLEKLAQNIDVKLGCDWVATIFSRDIRFANHEVTSHWGSCPCQGCRALSAPAALAAEGRRTPEEGSWASAGPGVSRPGISSKRWLARWESVRLSSLGPTWLSCVIFPTVLSALLTLPE